MPQLLRPSGLQTKPSQCVKLQFNLLKWKMAAVEISKPKALSQDQAPGQRGTPPEIIVPPPAPPVKGKSAREGSSAANARGAAAQLPRSFRSRGTAAAVALPVLRLLPPGTRLPSRRGVGPATTDVRAPAARRAAGRAAAPVPGTRCRRPIRAVAQTPRPAEVDTHTNDRSPAPRCGKRRGSIPGQGSQGTNGRRTSFRCRREGDLRTARGSVTARRGHFRQTVTDSHGPVFASLQPARRASSAEANVERRRGSSTEE